MRCWAAARQLWRWWAAGLRGATSAERAIEACDCNVDTGDDMCFAEGDVCPVCDGEMTWSHSSFTGTALVGQVGELYDLMTQLFK